MRAGSPPTTRVRPVLACWRPQLRADVVGTSVGKLSLLTPSTGTGVKPDTRDQSGIWPACEGARPRCGQHTLGVRPSNLQPEPAPAGVGGFKHQRVAR